MARKPHETKAEEARAGRKGGRAEARKREGGHAAEHKMAEVHVHHHHHHHGAEGGKRAVRKK